MTVQVYSTSWCPYCHALMDWLDSLAVEYEEIDAEEILSSKNPEITSVPCTKINTQVIYGFDRPAILKALEAEKEIRKND